MIKVAINGFGRIGRNAFKIALTKPEMEVVAINDLTDNATLAHLLHYDTSYGAYERGLSSDEQGLTVDGKKYPVFAEKEPTKLPWGKLGVDVVLECTGHFVDDAGARQHLTAGAKRVIISAPGKGGNVPTFVIGVNDHQYAGEPIISNASCTTNCLTPTAAVIHAKFGIVKAMMSTVHSYTADQNLQDGPHKDLRRARAAAENIVPTTTGAAISTTEVIPQLKGLFDGTSLRVPTPVGSICDVTFLLSKQTTVEEVNAVLTDAAEVPQLKGIIRVTHDPIVSSDIIGDPHSAIVDLGLTQVVAGDLVKVMAWYDNEWGYSNRLVEQVLTVGKSL
jgi:glyceraldehyde 3-phosphate dehydrogenase